MPKSVGQPKKKKQQSESEIEKSIRQAESN